MIVEAIVSWTDKAGVAWCCVTSDLEHKAAVVRGDIIYGFRLKAGSRAMLLSCRQCGERVLAAQRKIALIDDPLRRSAISRDMRNASLAAEQEGRSGLRTWLELAEAL